MFCSTHEFTLTKKGSQNVRAKLKFKFFTWQKNFFEQLSRFDKSDRKIFQSVSSFSIWNITEQILLFAKIENSSAELNRVFFSKSMHTAVRRFCFNDLNMVHILPSLMVLNVLSLCYLLSLDDMI